jgi:hypothetical protein
VLATAAHQAGGAGDSGVGAHAWPGASNVVDVSECTRSVPSGASLPRSSALEAGPSGDTCAISPRLWKLPAPPRLSSEWYRALSAPQTSRVSPAAATSGARPSGHSSRLASCCSKGYGQPSESSLNCVSTPARCMPGVVLKSHDVAPSRLVLGYSPDWRFAAFACCLPLFQQPPRRREVTETRHPAPVFPHALVPSPSFLGLVAPCFPAPIG